MDKATRDALIQRYAQRAGRATEIEPAMSVAQIREAYRDVRLLAREVEYLQQQIAKQDGYLRGLLDQLTLDLFMSLLYARGLPLVTKLYGVVLAARAALGMAEYPADYITRLATPRREFDAVSQVATPEGVAP